MDPENEHDRSAVIDTVFDSTTDNDWVTVW